MEAIVDWRKSASSTGTFVSIIMTGTVSSMWLILQRSDCTELWPGNIRLRT